jgi:hypothetical protein
VLKVIVANPTMIKEYKARVLGNGRPFPDGFMIALNTPRKGCPYARPYFRRGYRSPAGCAANCTAGCCLKESELARFELQSVGVPRSFSGQMTLR